MRMKFSAQLALCALAGFAANALAVDIPETEPNDTKATANAVSMMSGDRIIGNTTGSSTTTPGAASADYFLITVAAPSTPGIYKHQMVLTTSGAAGHTGTLRGLNQIAAAAGVWDGVTVGTAGTTDTTVQTSSTFTSPARMNQWFSLGGGTHQMIYRVTGTASTTANYEATLTTTGPITPISGPTVPAGLVVISTIGQTTVDTDMWLYDSSLNPIIGAGNDDESVNGGGTGATLQSRLQRTLTPGTYTLAISRFNLATRMGSPNDDDFRTGTLLDFPGAIACSSSTTAAADLDVSIGGNVVTVVGSTGEGYDIQFVQFTVADVTSASCGTSTGVEGQNVEIRVNATPATGQTITSVVVNASSINPSATSVALSNLGGGVWGANVLSQVPAGAYSFTYSVTDSASTTVNGTCPITVTASASGACCTAGACAVTREYLCGTGGGTFQGAGTNCGLPTYTASAGTTTYSSIASTGTLLSTASACDDCGETVTLPFSSPFDFYGAPFSSVGVSSNGLVTFGPVSTTFTNAVIPTAAAPNNFAAALWDDLNPGAAGDVYTLYDSVNNRFIISWEGVTQFGATTSENFQVILYGNTNNIELVYGAITPETPAGDYSAGIEDSTGSAASVNAGTPVANTSVLITYNPGVNPCGPTCDDIDFNNDGLFPDTQDVDDFLSVFAGGPCSTDPTPGCNDLDFNNDGLSPDTLDFDSFLSVFGGGPCL